MVNTDGRKYDIAIAGGGISGISCAYTAGKHGLSPVIIEKTDYLGGQITGGLVIPMMKTADSGINIDFLEDLVRYAKKFDAQIDFVDGNPYWFNPEKLKKVFKKMLNDVGCEILFNTEIKNFKKNGDKKIEKIFAEQKINSKILSLHIYSKYFVDATGNGNFCKILNCNFYPDDAEKQSETLRFIANNIDLEAFACFLQNYKDECTVIAKIGGDWHLSCAYTWESAKKWALEPIFNEAMRCGDLKTIDTSYFQLFTVPKMPNSVVFNCPKVINGDINGANVAIERLLAFCKKYFDGFQIAKIAKIADIVGVRDANRPKCKYNYTISDIKSNKRFKNEVLSSNYPVDIHSDKKDGAEFNSFGTYFLPQDALISADYDNLFVIGKHAGADKFAQAALRIQPTCASMGEAVAKYIKKITAIPLEG